MTSGKVNFLYTTEQIHLRIQTVTTGTRPEQFQALENPSMEERMWVQIPIVTKKLFTTDSCWEREKLVFFSSMALLSTALYGKPCTQEYLASAKWTPFFSTVSWFYIMFWEKKT